MYQSLPTGTQYTYPAPQQNPSSSEGRGSFDRATVSPEANREDPAGAGNSEPDEQGPPKKKRRRQALSCTECKRRKIKCDRAQPCGPCTRRNEQSKCQWNIIEPTDKTVPRGEFDELKAKFDELKASFDDLKARHDRLESAVARIPTPLFASQLPGPSSHYMTTSPIGASSSSHLTAGIPSHPAMVSAGTYHGMPPPAVPLASSSMESPRSPRRARSSSSSSSTYHRQHDPPTSSPTSAKPSPLSLAAIMTGPDSQEPKKSQAQTFIRQLDKRLRPSPPPVQAPAPGSLAGPTLHTHHPLHSQHLVLHTEHRRTIHS
ncbi:hypothetical protein JAAARDRAFT_42073 [Jaapia argillacea MUCL 33604]|uniref:Zn(2)-C6 fungal-type domain-containing protein n=1 Tax=Jaapia argillacea MUCL 33604 TaxID=933084 RepID=A0A067PIY0_9AGAM|nr:hypothetical protein JAAARDRAFT_42073 [Jaapia argillacea MUCL 33604]